MPSQILTTDDLREFKVELFQEMEKWLTIRSESSKMPKKFLKSSEVIDLLGISANTLNTLRINRIIPYTKVGGTIFFDWEDIEVVMKKNKKLSRQK